jgi:DNA-binding NarL/FixJ family response regulator
MAGYRILGALVASRRPKNPIGCIFLSVSWINAIDFSSDVYHLSVVGIAVANEEAIFSPAAAERIMQYFTHSGEWILPPAFPELTEREREVLALIARGLTNQAIADRLVLSQKTVRNHVSNIFRKLQVADRAEAIIRAREAGLGE